MEVRDVGSGANVRPEREAMLKAARRRELDIIVVWRLDRWGRSLLDLIGSLQELNELGVGFVSLSEALDLTTASGRALAGMLAVFAEFERDILRDRVKARIAQARQEERPHGRPAIVRRNADNVRKLHQQGVQQERDRQAPEGQPNLSPPPPRALAYKNFRLLRSPQKSGALASSANN
jgi:DNA invertase Pin-like site-specific DNA recombinase